MKFKKLEISNFRNIENLEIFPSDGINVIYGQNAQGKTSILEALWCFTGAKSFRGSKDTEMIRFGSEKSKIKLEFFDDERDQSCVIDIEKSRTAVLNDVPLGAASKIAGKIYSIVFSPNDLNIIKDGPSFRRKFLDTAIFQLYPKFIDISKRYLRAVDQRNKILKEIKFNPNLSEFLEDFESEIAELGSEIICYREKFVEHLKKFVPLIYNGISGGKEHIEVIYATTASKDKEEFKALLKDSFNADIQTLSTSVGPHRDDIDIKINGISARNFGSQGQKRSAALALKLAESEVISEITGKKPVALLDDVMSELDPDRQNYILNHICDWQVFITCCDPSNIAGLEKGKIFEIENGILKSSNVL